MSLNIKNKDVIELVEKAAQLSGTNKTETIKHALNDFVQKLDVDGKAAKYAQIMEIGKRCADAIKQNGHHFMSDDELYDEFGLPR